jgi:hypothetical protein
MAHAESEPWYLNHNNICTKFTLKNFVIKRGALLENPKESHFTPSWLASPKS